LWIRLADLGDTAAVTAIEQSAPSSWSASQIEDEIRHHNETILVVCPVRDHKPIGWCCLRYLPPEAELLKITILPRFRNSGYGSFLLAEAIAQSRANGCRELFLEVRQSNLQAQLFYRSNGFHQVGLRKKYYQDPQEDGFILTKKINAFS
jgi:[ribosomal protein S18]-alanine N-acetyltransferase